ncbi:urease subunit beta/urease subunit gamma/beta [Flavobacterium aquidurense]|uniref:Urease subunit beta n=1 Tax=Flavobacterium frigidimaris TaxID=262320 RepID=A0ABX4BW79_FLAFR|nr:urease subunit beta [Flavobacterium frigidimaris]OXA82019.1 urease subunit beta [Flavobacterium frigidimaris]SDY57122.1 urease subunit beta/urease subunit gamma/beta [Flavobacterium aquidurense]
MIPGEIILKDSAIICNDSRETLTVKVTNTGDRPIQVGSHFHFFEVNRMMSFDREKAFGMRLNIIASTAVRFEPGEEKEVELTEFGGNQRLFGHNNLVDGDLSPHNKAVALERLKEGEFKNVKS